MKPRAPRKLLREVLSGAVLVLGVLAARSSLADHYQVPTGSMLPTVQIGDHVLVDKRAYRLRLPFTHLDLATFAGPRRGDVVVCESPDDGTVLLKRVVAVPGDRVRVLAGRVYLDGALSSAEADHPPSLEHGEGPDFGPVVVPADQYLLLGDNRGNSRDGRYFGFVARDAILGRAIGIFWGDDGPGWRPL